MSSSEHIIRCACCQNAKVSFEKWKMGKFSVKIYFQCWLLCYLELLFYLYITAAEKTFQIRHLVGTDEWWLLRSLKIHCFKMKYVIIIRFYENPLMKIAKTIWDSMIIFNYVRHSNRTRIIFWVYAKSRKLLMRLFLWRTKITSQWNRRD